MQHCGRFAARQERFCEGNKKLAKVEVAPDEILCMVDSGSFVHAIDADVELPDHNIRENDPEERPIVCETARGGILKKLGTVRVNGEVHNESSRLNLIKCES